MKVRMNECKQYLADNELPLMIAKHFHTGKVMRRVSWADFMENLVASRGRVLKQQWQLVHTLNLELKGSKCDSRKKKQKPAKPTNLADVNADESTECRVNVCDVHQSDICGALSEQSRTTK